MKTHGGIDKLYIRKLIIALFLIVVSNILLAQVPKVPIIINDEDANEEKILSIAENTDAVLDYAELTEILNQYKENPININLTASEELKKLTLLNDDQIENLLNYINNYGQLKTIYELITIDGFDYETIFKILPYVVVNKVDVKTSLKVKDIIKYGKQKLLLRYENVPDLQLGYSPITDSILAKSPNQRYLGSSDKLLIKYSFNYNDKIKFGLIASKDAGEEFFKGSQKNGFDFYSAYFQIIGKGIIKNLIIGDYKLQFGQGLTLNTGMSFGKTPDAINLSKNFNTISPNVSSNNGGFLRGIATTFEIKHFDISIFLSSRKVDANVTATDTLTQEALYVSALQETGYHRTPGEIADKNVINELLYGYNISFKNKNLRIGTTAYTIQFDAAINKAIVPYNQFEFQGKKNSNLGIDYMYHLTHLVFFGEAAVGSNGHYAYLSGLQTNFDNLFSLSCIYRNYQKEYQNLKANSFGENSLNANEKGVFVGINTNLNSKITFAAYSDFFEFPWLKYRVDEPSVGSEYSIKLNYIPSSKLTIYILFKEKDKALNSTESQRINYVEKTSNRKYRINISYLVHNNITLKNQIEYLNYIIGSNYKHSGFLLSQDIIYHFVKLPLVISARYATFDTYSYDERIYSYENDVLYGFSIPSYYYKGNRFYIMLKYRLNKNIDTWIRYAVTYYSGKSVIGTGLDEIQGDTKSEIKLQMIIKL